MGRRQRGDRVVERLSVPRPEPALESIRCSQEIAYPLGNGHRCGVRQRGFFLDLGMHCGHLSGWIMQQVFCDSSQPPMSCGDSSCLWSQAWQEKGQAGVLTVSDSANSPGGSPGWQNPGGWLEEVAVRASWVCSCLQGPQNSGHNMNAASEPPLSFPLPSSPWAGFFKTGWLSWESTLGWSL